MPRERRTVLQLLVPAASHLPPQPERGRECRIAQDAGQRAIAQTARPPFPLTSDHRADRAAVLGCCADSAAALLSALRATARHSAAALSPLISSGLLDAAKLQQGI